MKNPRCINYRRQHVHKTRNGNKFAVTREERCQSFSGESMSAVLHLEIAKIYCDSLFFKGRSDIKRSERRLRLPILPQRCAAEGDAGDRPGVGSRKMGAHTAPRPADSHLIPHGIAPDLLSAKHSGDPPSKHSPTRMKMKHCPSLCPGNDDSRDRHAELGLREI